MHDGCMTSQCRISNYISNNYIMKDDITNECLMTDGEYITNNCMINDYSSKLVSETTGVPDLQRKMLTTVPSGFGVGWCMFLALNA